MVLSKESKIKVNNLVFEMKGEVLELGKEKPRLGLSYARVWHGQDALESLA